MSPGRTRLVPRAFRDVEAPNILSAIELLEGPQEAVTAAGFRIRSRQWLQAFIPKSHKEIAETGEPAHRFYNQAKRWGSIAPRQEIRCEAGTRNDEGGLKRDPRAHAVGAGHCVNVLGCGHYVL